jgi:ATP-dependent protease ClpP protease subunit
VKYPDDLVLMAKEEAVLQGMIDKVIEIEDVMAWK